MSAAPRAELVDLQRHRVSQVIAEGIDSAGSADMVFHGHSYANGYIGALVGNGLIDATEFTSMLAQVTAAANARLAALRGTPLNAPTGSPPAQPSPAAGPVGASSLGGS